MSRIITFLLVGAWDPFLSLAIVLIVCLYGWGLYAVWRRAGVGRGVTLAQASCFGSGASVLAWALASPLHALGEMLFAAHMVQHLLLMMVAAPLLLLGAPLAAFAWALPRSHCRTLAHWWQRRSGLRMVWGWFIHPLWVGGWFGLTLWLWHAPPLYEAALQDERWHALEHSTLLGVALLFWWVANPPRAANAQRRGAAILLLIVTAMHTGLLGALITFASTPWYASYRATTLLWGIRALADQQMAGVLMWWPMGLIFGAALLWQVAAWLTTDNKRRNALSPAQS